MIYIEIKQTILINLLEKIIYICLFIIFINEDYALADTIHQPKSSLMSKLSHSMANVGINIQKHKKMLMKASSDREELKDGNGGDEEGEHAKKVRLIISFRYLKLTQFHWKSKLNTEELKGMKRYLNN